MDAAKYSALKDLTYQKLSKRLEVNPSLKEELVEKFTEWFQGLVMMAKMSQQQMPSPQQQSNQGPAQQAQGE